MIQCFGCLDGPQTTITFLLERSEEMVVVSILARAWHQHHAPAQDFPAQILGHITHKDQEKPKNQGSLPKNHHLLRQNLPRSTNQPPLGCRRDGQGGAGSGSPVAKSHQETSKNTPYASFSLFFLRKQLEESSREAGQGGREGRRSASAAVGGMEPSRPGY